MGPSDVKTRGVLLVDPDPVHRGAVVGALQRLPAPPGVEERDSWDDVRAYAEDTIVLVHYAALDEAAKKQLAAERPRGLLVMAPMRTREECASLLAQAVFTNIVPTLESANANELSATILKMIGNDIFGIEKYFPQANRRRFALSRASERRALLDRAEAYLQELNAPARVTGDFCTVLDEFVTNAFYNAPTDAAGARRFAHLARSEEAELDRGEEVVVEMCSDGRRVGLATHDPFGSITSWFVLEHLARCFRREDHKIDRARGGAGLGLYYAFDLVSHFVIDVAPGKKTEMIGIMDLDSRTSPRRAKSLNIFQTD